MKKDLIKIKIFYSLIEKKRQSNFMKVLPLRIDRHNMFSYRDQWSRSINYFENNLRL